MIINQFAVSVIIPAVLLLTLFFLTISLEKSKATLLFSAVIMCLFIYSICYTLVINSKTTEIASKFFAIERIAIALITCFYLIFGVSFIEKYNLLKKQFLPIYFVLPFTVTIIILSNSSNQLFYSNPDLVQGTLHNTFSYTPSVWYYIQQFYTLTIAFIVTIVLIYLYISGSEAYRKKIITIVFGSLSFLILYTLFNPNMLGVIKLDLNFIPLISSISGLIIYFGLRRFNLFQFVPIARESLFDRMEDAVIVLDKYCNIVDFNERAHKYLNITKTDIGKKAEDALCFWEKSNCNETDNSVRKDIECKRQIEGAAVFLQLNISPLYNKYDIFQGQIIIARDISAQKKVEIINENQSLLLSTMLNNMPIGVFMAEVRSGKTLLSNPKAKELLGMETGGEITFESLTDVNHIFISGTQKLYPKNRMPIVRGMEGESSHIRDMEVERSDGSRIQLEMFGCPVIDYKGDVLASMISFFDISDRKMAEKRIQYQNMELKELNATKDKFFSIIAHDLKNSIQAIMGYSQLLHNNIEIIEKTEIIDYSSVIYSSTQNIGKLLENLLTWSRLKRGLIKFEPKKEPLQEVINESIEPLMSLATKKGVEVNINPQNGLYLNIDKQMICSVMRNLVSNAIKFTPKHGFIKVKSELKNDAVEITVEDSGIGMDNDIINNLFKIDAKISRSGTEGESSSGLGLLLCKEFVDKHKGKISVTSEPKKGSRLTVTLPL